MGRGHRGRRADLTATFQTYLGSTPVVVTVTPEGDAYRVRLDAGPMLAKVPAEAQATISVSPLEMLLTDKRQWHLGRYAGSGAVLTMKVATELDMTMSIDKLTCTGTYDTAIKAFASQDCTMANLKMDQTQVDPALGEMKTNYTPSPRAPTLCPARPGERWCGQHHVLHHDRAGPDHADPRWRRHARHPHPPDGGRIRDVGQRHGVPQRCDPVAGVVVRGIRTLP